MALPRKEGSEAQVVPELPAALPYKIQNGQVIFITRMTEATSQLLEVNNVTLRRTEE